MSWVKRGVIFWSLPTGVGLQFELFGVLVGSDGPAQEVGSQVVAAEAGDVFLWVDEAAGVGLLGDGIGLSDAGDGSKRDRDVLTCCVSLGFWAILVGS